MLNKFLESLRDRLLDFFLVSIVLAGILYAVISSYAHDKELNALKEDVKRAQDSTNAQIAQSLKRDLAEGNDIDGSLLPDANIKVAPLIDPETPEHKAALSAKQEQLNRLKEQRDVLLTALDTLEVETGSLQDEFRSEVRKHMEGIARLGQKRVSVKILEVAREAKTQLLKGFEETHTILDRLTKDLRSGESIIRQANVTLERTIVALQGQPWIPRDFNPNVEFPEFSFDPSVAFLESSVRGIVVGRLSQYATVLGLRHAPDPVNIVYLRGSGDIEVLDGRIRLLTGFNDYVRKTTEGVRTFNSKLRELIDSLREELAGFDDELVKLSEKQKELEEKVEAVDIEIITSNGAIAAALSSHADVLDEYCAEINENLSLLDRYLSAVAAKGVDIEK